MEYPVVIATDLPPDSQRTGQRWIVQVNDDEGVVIDEQDGSVSSPRFLPSLLSRGQWWDVPDAEPTSALFRRVLTRAEPIFDPDQTLEDELVTGAEIGRRASLTRERVRQLGQREDFPKRVARVGASVIWRWDDVSRYIAAQRAPGILVGAACGDAAGAPYEMGYKGTPPDGPIRMVTGGLTASGAVGEWTDDTTQAASVALAIAEGYDLSASSGAQAFGAALLAWFGEGPNNIGIHTEKVLAESSGRADQLDSAAVKMFLLQGSGNQNGSLMRIAPCALVAPGNMVLVRKAARNVATLTHAHPESVDCCIVVACAAAEALVSGRLNLPEMALRALPGPAGERLSAALQDAEHQDPTKWSTSNGLATAALSEAWSSIVTTGAHHDRSAVREAVELAIRAGGDTDTVACITGALVGAVHGHKAFPKSWREHLNGPAYAPDGSPRTLDTDGLADLALAALNAQPNWMGAERSTPPQFSGYPAAATVWSREASAALEQRVR